MSRLPKHMLETKNAFKRFKYYLTFKQFLKYIDFDDLDECWEWKGARDKDGYGVFWWPGFGYMRAHIASYRLFKGKVRSKQICHSCDNPPCCNPHHLWRGTTKENALDMVSKGRCNPRKGEQHPYAKLTEKDVLKIRKMIASGEYKHKTIARKFGVSNQSVCDIGKNRVWKHVR